MKRCVILLLFIISLSAGAQQYNNEWIRYQQTYYKFKIATKGLYRIPKSLLDNAGIGNTSVEFFELWKNGKLVPVYPSTSTGVLPSDGYLEFWGEGNDGGPDKDLYKDPAYQHSSLISLMTDTASYFLSVNANQAGFFYTDMANNVAANVLPAEPYYMNKAATYFKDKINSGFAAIVGEYVYSSQFDKGEFWSSGPIRPPTPYSFNQAVYQPYTAGPAATVRFGAMGDALNARSVRVSLNNTVIKDTIMDFFNDLLTSVSIPVSSLSSGNAAIKVENTSAVTTDRLVLSVCEITYPALFDFNNLKNYKFHLAASGTGYYLVINNFNYGSTAPVLLDLSTGARLTGDISTPGTARFVVPSGTERDFVLVNTDAANATTVVSLAKKNFKNYATTANQGDYIIITHPALYIGANGGNPIQEYKNYRSSAQGGSFDVEVAEIDELVDQFAFGIKKHPLSIKNFLRYARATFTSPLKYVFLIGRGMSYNLYRINESKVDVESLSLIPSFGYPASDNMLSSADAASPIAVTPIGRLSVVRGSEVEDYLEKIKEYENTQKTAPNTLAGREWMKNVIHVTGSSDPYLGTVLCNYMGVYRQILQDTVFGGRVVSFCKTSTNAVEQLNSQRIAQLFEEGVSMLTYFGHSSSTTLEFNLDNPQAYNNPGKYPVFFVNGCNAGNFFTYNPLRLLVNETLSEKFVLAKQRGSIAFVASTHYGIVNYLNIYLNNLYSIMARSDYGKSLGETMKDALQKLVTVAGPNDFYARAHAEEITTHGDPAIFMNEQIKPDYVIEDPQVKINPAFISIAEDNFQMKVRMVNIGKSPKDSIYVEIKREYPNGTADLILRKKIRGIQYADSLTINIPIIATRDKGLNKITVTIDADNTVDEISESNNSITKEVFIFEDEARAVFPYEYSIVNDPALKVFASTADPFSSNKDYVMEMDTTELFNSSMKVSKSLTSTGGSLEFLPGISYQDSTVYYWRVSVVPVAGGEYHWSNSSFIFINSIKEGFSQSHYYQKLNTVKQSITLNSDRKWSFDEIKNNIFVRLGTWSTSATQEAQVSITINNVDGLIHNTCTFSALSFTVFDPVTFKPWLNAIDPMTSKGKFFSEINNCYPGRLYNFEFKYTDSLSRRRAMDFMDNVIPAGAYVAVRAFVLDPLAYPAYPQAFIADWQKDTLRYGSNNSLYHRLYSQGFVELDSFYKVRPWIFVYKKNEQEKFFPKSAVARGTFDNINLSVDCPTPDTLGYITSPKFGPAKVWNEVIWRGTSKEIANNDDPSISVIGIDNNQNETTLYVLDKTQQNFDVSAVSADQYPFMKLKMRNIDSLTLTPYQLDRWSIHYTPVPEGALAPNIVLTSKDTLETGEPLKFQVAFKNISKYPFDSVAVNVSLLDRNNVPHVIVIPKQKPLIKGDTAVISLQIDTKEYPEANTLFVDVNPNNLQPEQHHFNNFLYKRFYVRSDFKNPLLDVTFDGVHILNKDLVSARPHIQIKLKDEAKYLLLNDTALASVQVRYPDGSVRTHHFDNDTLRFTPASTGVDNTATVDFYPQFTRQYNAEGDEYELIVKGVDRSGNKAGSNEFRTAFTVISKPMISNLLNYPNPFSTSTAFVFTITGTDVPQNMKIQVLTVTGKIVREITKEELGPIHIGRNITEYKWDGNDQFGQKLANGVYLYRFVTSLNGRRMDKYKAQGDNTDMYFNNGYGKMYLMR